MGRREQKKGRRGEIELSKILNDRGYNTRPGAAVSFGSEPDVVGLDGIHVEIKRRECPDIPAALRQAAEDAAFFRDGIPALFTRGNRARWRVVMDIDEWLKLYNSYYKEKSQNK